MTTYDPNKPMFQIGDHIRYGRNTGIYYICGLPSRYKIRNTDQPAYAFFSLTPATDAEDTIFIKAQNEIEDGRYVKVTIEEYLESKKN